MLEMGSPLTNLSNLGVIHFDEVSYINQAVKGGRKRCTASRKMQDKDQKAGQGA